MVGGLGPGPPALTPLNPAPSSISINWWGKGGNVTSAGWQVTLCDHIWHVSSRSVKHVCELLYKPKFHDSSFLVASS